MKIPARWLADHQPPGYECPMGVYGIFTPPEVQKAYDEWVAKWKERHRKKLEYAARVRLRRDHDYIDPIAGF